MDENSQNAIRYWTLAQPILSAYVTSVVRDFRDRDDVLQSIAVAVLESFPSYDPSRPFIAWAAGIARHQLGTYLRERKRNCILFDAETVERLATAFEQLPGEQTHPYEGLHECLAKLDDRARQMCVLRYDNDLKPAAMASLLGMTPNAVAKALQRIRDQLRRCIEKRVAIDGGGS